MDELGLKSYFMVFCTSIAGALGNVFTLKMAIKLLALSQLV